MTSSEVRFTSDHPSARDIIDLLRAAISYPGCFGDRQHSDAGQPETREQWQARAAYQVVGPLIEQRAQVAAAPRPSGGTLPPGGGLDSAPDSFIIGPRHAAVPDQFGIALTHASIPDGLLGQLRRAFKRPLSVVRVEPDSDAEPEPVDEHQALVAYGESRHPLAPHLTRSAAAAALFALVSELADACGAAESLPADYVREAIARHLG